jgi:hypothetical protein
VFLDWHGTNQVWKGKNKVDTVIGAGKADEVLEKVRRPPSLDAASCVVVTRLYNACTTVTEGAASHRLHSKQIVRREGAGGWDDQEGSRQLSAKGDVLADTALEPHMGTT